MESSLVSSLASHFLKVVRTWNRKAFLNLSRTSKNRRLEGLGGGLGRVLGHLEGVLGQLGGVLGQLGAVLDALGGVLRALGEVLEPS